MVTLTAGLTVRLKVVLAVFDPESVTETVKVAVPVAAGLPESTPPLERLKFTAVRLLAPAVTVQV